VFERQNQDVATNIEKFMSTTELEIYGLSVRQNWNLLIERVHF